MSNKKDSTALLLAQKLLPLYYHDDEKKSILIMEALYQAGVRMIEYTNRGEKALHNFRALKKEAQSSMPGLQVGIGTIKQKKQAKHFIASGADFIVSPTINEEVGKITHEAGLLWIPGCMTPTEVGVAEKENAGVVKIFPGNIVGPSFISAIRDLFPGMRFMPTGGVEMEESNLLSWFNAGAVAVGMGSKLITKELVAQGDYAAIRKRTEDVIKMIGVIG